MDKRTEEKTATLRKAKAAQSDQRAGRKAAAKSRVEVVAQAIKKRKELHRRRVLVRK